MGSVLAELKSEREKRKVSLAQIAAETNISLYHLENLEEGRFGLLPGGMYNRAFLRAYCEALDLDAQDILDRFEEEVAAGKEQSSRPGKHVHRGKSVRISPIMIWSLMLLVSATGLFLNRKRITAAFAPYFSHEPVSIVRTTPPTPQPEAIPSLPQRPPPEPAPLPEPAGLRLEVTAREECWISVDHDGTRSLRKTLEPGEVQSFEAAERFSLILGNAGGVDLRINGKPARTLGTTGEVVKIEIDETSLRDLIAQETD